MYQLPIFREDSLVAQHDLMRTHNFCTIVTSVNGDLNANHIPMMLHPELGDLGTLRGHISKGNPLWKIVGEGIPALIIFQGSDHYISPNWYPSKAEHHKEVPTWNYAAVHVNGELKITTDADWLMDMLHNLTNHHERDEKKPWKVTDAPEKYLGQQLKGIVGLELVINRIEGKVKAGQNKKEQDIDGAIENLSAKKTEAAQLAANMMSKAKK
jgi:transcriptional regulator